MSEHVLEGEPIMTKNTKVVLGVLSILLSVLAIPVAFFVNWALGLFLLSLPIYLIYKTG